MRPARVSVAESSSTEGKPTSRASTSPPAAIHAISAPLRARGTGARVVSTLGSSGHSTSAAIDGVRGEPALTGSSFGGMQLASTRHTEPLRRVTEPTMVMAVAVASPPSEQRMGPPGALEREIVAVSPVIATSSCPAPIQRRLHRSPNSGRPTESTPSVRGRACPFDGDSANSPGEKSDEGGAGLGRAVDGEARDERIGRAVAIGQGERALVGDDRLERLVGGEGRRAVVTSERSPSAATRVVRAARRAVTVTPGGRGSGAETVSGDYASRFFRDNQARGARRICGRRSIARCSGRLHSNTTARMRTPAVSATQIDAASNTGTPRLSMMTRLVVPATAAIA